MVGDHPFLYQAKRDLERAEASRAKAEALLRTAEIEISRLRSFIEQYEIYASDSERQINQAKFRAKSRTIADVAVSLIENSENPLHIQQILDGLSRNGVEVGGENKAANLAAYLSKDNRVRFERGLGWMISGERLFSSDEQITENAVSGNSAPPFKQYAPIREQQIISRSDANARRARAEAVPDVDDDIPF